MDLDSELNDAETRIPKNFGDKRLKWRDVEVITLLELMMKHNLLDRNLTDRQVGEVLMEPMNNIGFERTSYQIQTKIKGLRRTYVKCVRAGCTKEALKECPFYDLLKKLYIRKTIDPNDSLDQKILGSEDDEVEDIWTKEELETMLSLIQKNNLQSKITLYTFSSTGLQEISLALEKHGYYKSIKEVEVALQSLKVTFIKFKKNYQRGQSTKDCPYFRYLNKMWGEEYVKTPKPRLRYKLKDTEIWSEEETVMLLTSISELDIVKEAFQNTDYAAEKLVSVLNDSGYSRTKEQLQRKMHNLMQNYLEGKRIGDEAEVIHKFPFISLYETLFAPYFKNFDFKSFGQVESEEYIKKHTRGACWSKKETKTLLNLIIELKLARDFRDRVIKDAILKLIEPLRERGFERNFTQIKIKIKSLRQSYMRCIEANCTPQALLECPFYNELNNIYGKSPIIHAPSLEPRIIIRSQKRITESNIQELEHSYVQFDRESVSKAMKLTARNKNSLFSGTIDDKTTWTPIETIIVINGVVKENICIEKIESQEWEFEDEQIMAEIQEDERLKHEFVNEEKLAELLKKEIEEEEQIKTFEEEGLTVLEIQKEEQDEEERELVVCSLNEEELNCTNYFGNENHFANMNNLVTEELDQNSVEIIYECADFDELSNNSIHAFQDESHLKVLSQQSPRKRKYSETSSAPLEMQESSDVDSMPTLISSVMEHETLMQKKHQQWLERQFELQREHDREQRNILLNELKEFRQAIKTVTTKQEVNNVKSNMR